MGRKPKSDGALVPIRLVPFTRLEYLISLKLHNSPRF